MKLPFETMLQVSALDQLRFITYSKTKDAQKGRRVPKPLMETILGNTRSENVTSFASAEEFEARRMEILRGG